MDIAKARRDALLAELKNFYDMQGGLPADWQDEIDDLDPDDSPDGLDIIVGHLCSPEFGGSREARNILYMIGASTDETEALIALNCDLYF